MVCDDDGEEEKDEKKEEKKTDSPHNRKTLESREVRGSLVLF